MDLVCCIAHAAHSAHHVLIKTTNNLKYVTIVNQRIREFTHSILSFFNVILFPGLKQ